MERLSFADWNAIGAGAIFVACLGGYVSGLNWRDIGWQPKFFFLFALFWCGMYLQSFAHSNAGGTLPFGLSLNDVGAVTMPLANANLCLFVGMTLFGINSLWGIKRSDPEKSHPTATKRHGRPRNG